MAKIVIVGGGAAGASAAARAKRLDPNAEVLLIEATSMITHAPCGIPYAVAGVVEDVAKLRTYSPEEFQRERGIRVLTRTRAIDIDVDKRTLTVSRNGSVEKIEWDKLVLATGAKPLVPKMPGVDLGGILTLRHPEDVMRIKELVAKANSVAVVGGGYIGIEMAEALLKLGKRVVLFEALDQLLPASLDSDMANLVAEEMKKKGVELHLSEKVVEFAGSDRVSKIVTEKGEYEVDGVILAIGVKPDADLALKAGIKLGETGAVHVNEFMETSTPDIYAAGDLVEKTHRVTKRKVWIPLAPSANKEGQVAGGNAARGRVLRFPGIVGTAVTKFFDLYIARTGLTEREASSNGFNYEAKTIKARTKAHYYPGWSEVHLKMVIERNSGRILGVQSLGWDPIVASYVDVAAVAIEREMTIEDLFFADLGYTPATSPVWAPLITAARVLSKGKF